MKKSICLMAGLAAIAFCGCQTVQDARDVQSNKTPVIGEYTPKAADFGINAEKTMTLEELQLIALKSHPAIRIAANNAAIALINVQNVKADFLPTVDIGGGYARYTNNTDTTRQSTRTHGTYSGYLDLELMIYDFGKTDAHVKQLTEIYKSQLMLLEVARNLVVSSVRQAYFNLNRTIELDVVAKQTVKQYQEHRDHVKMKKEVGSGTSYDLTKAEVDVYNAILKENITRNDIDIARAALMQAMGLAETTPVKVANATLKEYTLDINALFELANAGNPELASLKIKEDAAKIYIDKTINDLYPTFSLSLGSDLNSRNFDNWLWNLSGMASVAQNVFNGGRNMNAIQDAALQLKNARSARATFEQLLFQQLRNASLNAQLAQEQFKVAQEVEKQAQEYFDIVSAQYSVGKSTALGRTDAQVALSDAQAQVVSAKYDYQDALAKIAQLIGDSPRDPAAETAKPAQN